MLKFKVGDYVVSKNGKDYTGDTASEYGGVGKIVEYDPGDGTYLVLWPNLDGDYDDYKYYFLPWQLLPWSVK